MGAPSGGDPARKMSRVMGTSAEQESTFLSGRVNINYQKKKVITWCFPIEIFLWNEVIEIFLSYFKIQATGSYSSKIPRKMALLLTQNFLKKWFLVCALCYLFPKPWIFPRKKNWKQNWYAEFVISLRNKNDLTMKKDRKSQNQLKKKETTKRSG